MRHQAKAPESHRTTNAKRAVVPALLATFALLLTASPASATVGIRPFQETFGSAAQPSFVLPEGIFFDPSGKALLVPDSGGATEKQELTIEAEAGLGGTYELSLEGQSTGWEGEGTLLGSESGSGDLSGAEGTAGIIANNSNEIKGVSTTSGAFAVGQKIELPGIFPAGTEIVEINGTTIKASAVASVIGGQLSNKTFRAGLTEVKNVTGSFTAGNGLGGPEFQPGTIITAVGAGTLTLSKVPVQTGSAVSLTASSGVVGLLTSAGMLSVGEEVSGSGVQPGTTVSAVDEAINAFLLSKPPNSVGASPDLKADLPFDASGQVIGGALEKLPGIGLGNLRVEGEAKASPVKRTIEFVGALHQYGLPLLGCDSTGLTGTAPTCTVTETARGHHQEVSRYHEDGTAAPFAALGTHSIDGRRGPGGKPCAEEAASCDETPQNGFNFGSRFVQVAVDDSGGPTDGNIYVASNLQKLVDVFAADGHYLGQLTKYTESGKEKNLSEACGVAVDGTGSLYVADTARVHKYVPSAGPPLNSDNTANSKPVAEPCDLAAGAGLTAGSVFVTGFEGPVVKLDGSTLAAQYVVAPGQYPGNLTVAVNPANGHVFAARQNESAVNEYDASGATEATLLSQAPVTGPGIAVDPADDELYVALENGGRLNPKLKVYGPPPPAPTATTGGVSGLAQTAAILNGTVDPKGSLLESCSFEWGLDEAPYEHAEPCAETPAEIGEGEGPVAVHLDLSGLVEGATYHYRLAATNPTATDQGADRSFITPTPPAIEGAFVEGVTRTEATLRAQINPHGFPTTYRVEYGPEPSYGLSSPTRSLSASDDSPHQVTVSLEGLKPGTVYHWRFLASNEDESIPGTGETPGADRTFTTYAAVAPDTACPNRALRVGSSAGLPDCRAYEMVSPVDKNGQGVGAAPIPYFANEVGPIEQSSLSGNKITYTSPAAFGDQPGGANANQYLADRGPGGWSTHGINPPRGPKVFSQYYTPYDLDNPFQAFSEDLSSAWVINDNQVPLTADGIENFGNLYRRDNLADSYEALTVNVPTLHSDVGEGKGLEPEFRAASADGAHQVFDIEAALTPDAALTTTRQVYDFFGGELHLVSVLPDGTAAAQPSYAGSLGGLPVVRNSRAVNVAGAVSADGSRVFWTSAGTGLYLRENPAQPQSALSAGECTEAEKACTTRISGGAANAQFWVANPAGSKAIFSEGDLNSGSADLFEYDVETKTSSVVAHEVKGVLGAGEDLSHLYFVSKDGTLAPGATPGEYNLYLDHEGAIAFIAMLPGGFGQFSPVDLNPLNRHVMVTPDGRHIAFMSKGKALSEEVAGYDNTDLRSGEADFEVYAYEADGELLCVSCNPSGARPIGARPIGVIDVTGLQAAAWIPAAERETSQPHFLSDDGSRLYFNSFDALLPDDTNGRQDVYQWEASGAGTCSEASSAFSARNGGCISLISSGESPVDSEFVDASADGRDVFIRTAQSLDARDPGLVDIYDARVGGGFPLPPSAPECLGDACQSASAAPGDPTPAFEGAGNVQPGPSRCAKGKVRRRGRCVAKHRRKRQIRAQRKRAADHGRRAGR